QYRRSIYVAQDIKAGDVLTSENLRIVRPAFGLSPKHWSSVLGKTAKTDLVKGTPLDWQWID
ncbi:SAF domain-containing protein, partial [Paraglaciecola sp.]|uniref:SAF domain-containing protein n=1 Tax=Paraglaciecola sp. TaxID=1920173 RepID=UPI00273FD705